MSASTEVLAFLDDAGVVTSGTDGFADEMPPDPDTCLAVIDYPSRAPDYALGQALPSVEYSNVQITARAATKGTARALARSAYNAIAVVKNATVAGAFHLKWTPKQQPFRLSIDASRRTTFAFNVDVEKRR